MRNRWIRFRYRLSRWIYPTSFVTVEADAKTISPQAIVLYDNEDKFKFAFALFKTWKIFNAKELYRYGQKAQGKIGKANKAVRLREDDKGSEK